jgi:hypothetical protein
MNEIYIVAIIIIVFVGIAYYLYTIQSEYIKSVDNYKNKLDANNELLNNQNIELAIYSEKVIDKENYIIELKQTLLKKNAF